MENVEKNPDSLSARVLQVKYFPSRNIVEAKPVSGMSYAWCSVLKGLDLLREGIIWRIGIVNGANTNIWQDPWIPGWWTRRPITVRGQHLLTQVAELIDPSTGSWDKELVLQTFWPEDAEVILHITTNENVEDFVAWHPNKKGLFLVRSAHKIFTEIRARNSVGGVTSSSHSSVEENVV